MENIDITNATIPTMPIKPIAPVQGSSVALPFGGCTSGSARLAITESARRGRLETKGHVGHQTSDRAFDAAFGTDAYFPGTTAWSPPI